MMKKWKEGLEKYLNDREKNREFQRVFLRIAVGVLLIVLAGMSILYGVMRSLIAEQNIQVSAQAFSQVQREFEDINNTANVIAAQVLLDDICSDLLETTSAERPDSLELNRVRNQLTMYQTANSMVESIYIYSARPDLLLTSGSRFGAVGLDDFSDRNIVYLLKNPKAYKRDSLILRKMIGVYPNDTDAVTQVYTYILFDGYKGNAIVINLNCDEILRRIQAADILDKSRLLIIDEKNDRLVDIQSQYFEESDKLKSSVLEMAESGEENREVRAEDGERYFVSYLYSDESGWNYIKVTRWEEVFGILIQLGEVTVGIAVVIIFLMFLVVAKNLIPVIRLQGLIQMRQTPKIRQSELNQLKEGFLSDFLHGRKLFTRGQLKEKMENFGLEVAEDYRYRVLLLKLEDSDKFKELYGKKGTYDIEFGYWNIFEETYGKYFEISGVINRDHTMTFLVKTNGVEQIEETMQSCFEEFIKNQRRFIRWEFFCAGMEESVPLEEIPEANEKLKKVLKERFFYPADTYCTFEQLEREHSGKADYRKLEAERLVTTLRGGKEIDTVYKEMTQLLEHCSSTEYMNAMIWFGITVMRESGIGHFGEEEINNFLMQLTRCEKRAEVDGCFLQLFEKIRKDQENSGGKKGVAGRLDEAQKYLEANFRDPNITLERLAEEFGSSPNYLGRMFKKDTGMSVSEYLNEIRLREVKRELRETSRTAKVIAEQCGFISSNYFYTYFRKKTGVTPQTYREKWRECDKGEMKK